MSLLLNGFWLVNNYLPKLRYIIDGFPYSSFILNSAWFLSVNSTFRGDLLYPRPQIATTNIVLFVKDIENVPIFHVSDSAMVTPHCWCINLQWGLVPINYTEITDGIKSTFGCTFPITFKNRCFAGSVIVNRIYACWMPNLTTNTWEAGNFRGYYQTKNTTADSFDIIYFVIGK